MKVRHMTGDTGKKVLQQFVISTQEPATYEPVVELFDEVEYLQSYDSIIAKKVYGTNTKVYLDRTYWDYSTTTGKYRNRFLGETKKETEKKIKSGEYILTDLN